MSKKQRKEFFRRGCLEVLKKASRPLCAYRKDKQIVATLYHYIHAKNARQVMLYLPLTMEVNLYPLIKKLRQEKRVVLVPFMEGASFRLVKYRLPLKQKKFGIKEPFYSRQFRMKYIDMAVVPIVGMDSTWRRIGFGKGMYDRFFEKNNHTINETVFISRHMCYSKEVVTDHYDVRADMIMTSS